MLQAADLPARYELRDRLGAGGMGEVWRAFDRERGAEVALKVLTGGDAEARFLFKQEFWALAELRHPGLVAGFDYGETAAGQPFFTMELVEGRELGTLDEAGVRALLPGLLAALAYLHARGWLHGDLKPENVRVGADGAAKLMDLGLLQRLGRPAGAIRGTLAYLAPEAVRQGALDARADLYALGAVLFHVLTGRPPFAHAGALALLRAHLEERPPAVRELAPGVSAELDAAVRRLLAKDPADRFGSAAELAAALGLEAGLDEGAALLAAPLVGRDGVFEALRAALAGAGGAHVVTGPSGSGRTRLLEALRAEAQLAGVATLSARGEGADAPPYQALRPWLRAVAAHRGPSFERLAPLVARLAPEVGRPAAPALDGAQERLRAHDALATLAAEAVPADAAWLLDDADRLDPASRELVAALRRAGAGWRWLMAGGPELAVGPGEVAHPLPALGDAEVRALAGHLLGLAPEALPPEVADRLPALAGGRPGAAEAALAHWVRTGALVRGGGRWVAAPGATFDAPGDLAGALAARVAGLGEGPAAIARAAARLGAPADLAWLAAVVDLDDRDFFAGLASLRAAGVLAVEGDRFRFERQAVAEVLAAGWGAEEARAFHARAFETLVSPPRGGDSREAAGAGDRDGLRSDPHPAPAALSRPGGAGDLTWLMAKARHGLASSTPEAGIPWAIAASHAAFAIHAVPAAQPLLDAALAIAPEDPELLGLLGYVRRFTGDVDGALALYDDRLLPLLREAPGPALVEHLVTRGVLLQLKGRYDDALAAHAEAINLADAHGASYQAIRARLFAGRVGVFAGQAKVARTTLRAAVKRARALVEAGGDDAVRSLLGRALSFLGYVTATGDPGAADEGLAMLDEAVALNRAIGDLRETHEALNNQGNVFMALGRYPAARDVFTECLALCGRMGSPNEAVIAHLNLGGALLELGMPAEAAGHARTAADAARAQGRQFPEGYARALLGSALLRTGAPAEGLAELEAGLALARAIGNRYLELNVLAYRAQALLDAGAWHEATLAIAQARSLAASSGNEEFAPKLARAELALAVLEGRPGAGDALAAAVSRARAGNRDAELAHALRWAASWHEAAGAWNEAARAALEALGIATALGLVRVQAELHLALAGIVAGGGHPDRAAEHLARAQGLARASGDALGEAVAASALARAAGDPRAGRQAAERLEAMLAGLDDAARAGFLRFPERRAALAPAEAEGGLAPARVRHLTALVAAIADAADLPAVMDQALTALIALADAERGFLVLYDGFEERERLVLTAPGVDPLAAGDAFSSSVAEQVLWTGEPLFVEDAGAHEGLAGQASVMALALRSVIGLPLRAGGRTIGVMIADSRRLASGFGEAERELTVALAQAVALAIAHARRHDEAAGELAALRAGFDLARATAGVTDLAAFGQAALQAALRACGAERGFWLRADDLAVLAARGPAGELPAEAPDLSGSVCRWVLEHGEPLHMVDVQSEEAFQAARSVMALGLRTIWALPLRAEGRAFGLLYLDSQRLGEAPGAAMRTLGAIADLAGAFVARQAAYGAPDTGV